MYGSWTDNDSIVETFFRNHFRPMWRIYVTYLFRKSANSNFKILIDCSFLMDDFENRFLKNYSSTTTKSEVKNS